MRWPHGAYATIALVVIATHGLLLLNDGYYWDGWIIGTKVAERDFDTLASYFRDAGFPVATYLHWAMGVVPDTLLAYRVTAVASLLAIGWLAFSILDRLYLTAPRESLLAALVAVTYPAYAIAVGQFVMPDLILTACFLCGARLALESERRTGVLHLALRVAALALLGLSFDFKPLLSLYAGLAVVRIVALARESGVPLGPLLLREIPRRADFLALPFAYLVVNQVVFPPRAVFAAAYHLPSPVASVGAFVALVYYTVFESLNGALATLLGLPLAAALVLAAAALWSRRAATSRGDADRDVPTLAIAVAGAALLFFALFPFAALARTPVTHGWLQRYAFLVPLPLGLLLVASLRYALGVRPLPRSFATGALAALVVAGLATSTVEQYLVWQGRWARDRSIMSHLARIPNASAFSVYWIDDRFGAGGHDYYAVEDFHEWASLFHAVWGGQSRIGLDPRTDVPERYRTDRVFHTSMNELADLDPAGCQATLTIRRGALTFADAELAARYIYYRLVARDRMSDLLERLTQVDVVPRPSADALHCRSA